MQIKAEEISKIIEDQIKNYEQRVEMSETGTVLYVGDGIARVYGVQNAMSMELLEFPGGVMGMVLNLKPTTWAWRCSDRTWASKKATRSNVRARFSPCP